MSLGVGTGVVRYINGGLDFVTDLIPVDFVSNYIIVATALEANKPNLTVINCGTSH